ncbi:MAG TPA: PQQ-binding-like beta-propeller repeat protein [Verrucomicrobiota bacterium]|nr:PQQ-binding-like beta-propeller repeat protein [Verrucomicrobiota bacterium]HPC51802.1 PQQ-binding-like beta-propeller repeat protein [Verrucomicrobiota bacterium]HPL35767.1 PQQ-binding-like beta-propeller repeat protein [Verrucomicrobiota bacterium]HRV39027.1 PQQ-binding-like beta-propeller repeat protein [Candidatus Paceibacterota bacterium]
MKTPSTSIPVRKRRHSASVLALWLAGATVFAAPVSAANFGDFPASPPRLPSGASGADGGPRAAASPAEAWTQLHRDAENTGRADFIVPTNRMGTNFFAVLRWQTPAPGSPNEGNLSCSAMVFFDGVGPDGADLVVSGYHWPKGVQGMDRHTGQVFWSGNPAGGESIGVNTPAFSPDGATIYVINDDTPHPLMAFASAEGPSVYWHNEADADPERLGIASPKVAPDGRIFAHAWNDRPYAGTDSGTDILVTWEAESELCECLSRPAIWTTAARTNVLAAGRCAELKAFDGASGDEWWSVTGGLETDADPTVDPASGRVYLPIGAASIRIVGVDADGEPLWSQVAMPVFDWQDGVNHPQRAQSAGCLAQDGLTFYFQTVSQEGDGRLYAINTADGSVKWSYATGSKGWDSEASSPIVTPNGVLVVGNNEGGTYFALRDDGANATLLDTLTVAANGTARSTATLSSDGLLYLPARLVWTQSNGDGQTPSQQAANLYNAFDLNAAPEIHLPPPAGQAARPLNAAIELQWLPVPDPMGHFSHYAIYRAPEPFTSLAGLTPVATLSNRLATTYLDSPLVNGASYYYFVATVTLSGGEPGTVTAIGGFRPYDETDLQVVGISRTPRFPRYAAEYTDYEITEPSGYGPYRFSAATGLGHGQTTNTPRWPAINAPVTYTATVRNRGSNPWTNAIAGVWQWDGTNAASNSVAGPLAPGGRTTFTFARPWDGAAHDVRFLLTTSDARAGNNAVTINTKSVAFLSYIDASYYESFRFQTTNWANAVTDDLIDWIQYHMARFNQMFASANCAKRVHYDVLELLADTAPDPAVDTLPFAVFPFRFYAHEAPYSYRNSGWYNDADDIDYGYLHEMGHQLGLIDIYQLDLSGEMNQVSGLGYTGPDDLMRACSPFFSPHSALAMNHWLDQAHGYFGQYLYGIPAEVKMRFLTRTGQPLHGAAVKVYQLEERPDEGRLITPQVKAQGLTDSNGVLVLPNVPIDPAKVPPLPTGDVLRANPFGYVAVTGANGVLHFRLEYEGVVDYAWLDITEANVAYYQGETNQATFTRQVTLGGPIQRFPPRELTETNAADWVAWAEGGASGGSTVTNDTSRRQVGQASLKFVTDGGFDTWVRYPGTFNALWDLTEVSTLNIRFYVENPNLGFQNGSPWIRLKDGDGNYVQYQYYQDGWPYELLNDARDAWLACQIPLAASPTEENGWRRSTFGAPDLSRITALEIHADTWGSGFTLWIDGVSFEPPRRPKLSVAPEAGGIAVSWPATHPEPVLEAANHVLGPYAPVAVMLTEAGGIATAQLPATGGQRYFRLRMP